MSASGWTLPLGPAGSTATVCAPPWHYAGSVLAIEFEADPAALGDFVPGGFTIDASGRCSVVVCDWSSAADDDPTLLDDPSAGQYHEAFVSVHGSYAGSPASRVTHIWVDNDVALMRGHVQGFPKQLGAVALTRARRLGCAGGRLDRADTFHAHVSRRAQRLVTASVTANGGTDDFPAGLLLPQVHTRRFPRIAPGGAEVDELVVVETTATEIADVVTGAATLSFGDSLAAFTPARLRAGFLLDAAFTVTGGRLAG